MLITLLILRRQRISIFLEDASLSLSDVWHAVNMNIPILTLISSEVRHHLIETICVQADWILMIS